MCGETLGIKPLIFYERYIPACAGETPLIKSYYDYARVHPRVCGGNQDARDEDEPPSGTSPRVRGKRVGIL